MEKVKKQPDKILVIDDEPGVLQSLVSILKGDGFQCITAVSAQQGIELMVREDPLVILTDLRMGDDNNAGIGVLEEAKSIDPNCVVLLYTAYGTVPNAVEAFKKGAFDFIQKVQTHHDILLPMQRAAKFAKMQKENTYLKSRLDDEEDSGFHNAIATSRVMMELFEKAKRLAKSDATIMITGEPGTGKGILARGIHFHSNRRKEKFIPVAVGDLPTSLLESELFGHAKGSFTGSTGEKMGLFEAAEGGTLFLDEIAEVNLDMQHKLLRVLEERTIRRVGEVKERPIDVRFLSATNKDPEELVKEGKMREDLFWRLNVINLKMPALRERKEEIPVLAYHFLQTFSDFATVPVKEISSDALLALQDYDWPGNIRELQAVIQEMLILATQDVLLASDLPEKIKPSKKRVVVENNNGMAFKDAKNRIIEEFEKNYIENLLSQYNGNITRVAEAAGLNRKTIYRLMESLNIPHARIKTD